MTKQEKKRLSLVLRATEYLFLENIALKLVLEHREVPEGGAENLAAIVAADAAAFGIGPQHAEDVAAKASRSSTPSSLRMSSKCSPVVGSSST